MDTKQLKQKILDLAIRGKLVPQDPNDEPASVLLERIRKEKEQLIASGKLKKSKSKTTDTPHYENVPFEIPDSWEWVRLEDVARVIHGKNQTSVENPQGKYPIYGSGGILGYADDYLCPEHCTIVGRKGTINNPILVETKFWNVDTAFGLHPNSAIDYLYFHYFCKDFDFSKLDKSTALPSLTKSTIEQIAIPIPPFNEQKRIVSEIQRWFANIDKIEQNKQDLQEYIKQAKSKVLDLAIHGKLVPQDPNDEPAIDLLKRINPSFKPCDTSHYENLPKGWKVCHLSEVIDLLDNKRQPIKAEVRAERIKGKKILFPYYGATGFAGYIDDYLIEGKFILLGEDGAPFLDKYAEKAYAVGGKIWVNNHAHVLQPKIDFDYLRIYLNAFDYYGIAKGTTRLKLTQGDMNQIPVWVPPLQEQMKISSKVQAVFTAIDTITAEL
ncbi:MAG: restriction endonuclease subunit S [Bacteroidales bacterium]|nr:restriction endonuclease subunit S [Bacteroidales bacterium]